MIITLIAIVLCSCEGYNQAIENGNQIIKEVQVIEKKGDTILVTKYVLAKDDSLGLNIKLATKKESQQEENSFFYTIKDGKNGGLLAYKYVPYIESGDFSVVIHHYFDREGRTAAYKKTIRFFNAVCTDGVLVHEDTKYFNLKGQLVKSIELTTDSNGKEINRKGCINNYIFNDKIFLKKNQVPFFSKL